jgi:nucleotide-binding universal stress UspA family protein
MEGFDSFRSILVGFDGSAEAHQAVATAVSLAKHYSSKLTLLWVKTPPPAEEQAEGYGLEEFARDQVQHETQIHVFAKDGRQQGLDINVAELDGNAAAREIEHYIQEHQVDLLVVGHRHLSRLRHLLEGSTAERLLRNSSTSVLVVHKADTSNGHSSPKRS